MLYIVLIYRTCTHSAPARPLRARFVRVCCIVAFQEHALRVTLVQCNSKQPLSSHVTLRSSRPALHSSHPALHTPQFISSLSALLISSPLFSLLTCHLSKFFSTQLCSSHPSTGQPFLSSRSSSQLISVFTSESSLSERERSLAQEKHWAQKVVVHIYKKKTLQKKCTTKFAQSTSQYYFAQSTLQYFFVSTKFAQNSSRYYLVLKSSHKAFPNATLYYKVCTNCFPVLLCAAKLAQSTSRYYSVLQSCTKYIPVLLCAPGSHSLRTRLQSDL